MGDSSEVLPDWGREDPRRIWDPSRRLLKSIRRYQRQKLKRTLIAKVVCKLTVVEHIFWSAITGADIPLNCQLGGGLLLPHPNGVVISPRAKVGVNCLIFQQVTLGSRGEGAPVIGDHVDIGAGAKILGTIEIGSHVKVGANSVVINDVPANKTVVGIPAKVAVTKAAR